MYITFPVRGVSRYATDLAVSSWPPQHVVLAAAVKTPGHDEKMIRETIEIGDGLMVEGFRRRQLESVVVRMFHKTNGWTLHSVTERLNHASACRAWHSNTHRDS